MRPTYTLRDPNIEPWYRDFAVWLDNAFDRLVGTPAPPDYVPRASDVLADWPEAQAALRSGQPQPLLRRAPDGTPFIAAAQRVESADRPVLLLTVNARDVRRVVRAVLPLGEASTAFCTRL